MCKKTIMHCIGDDRYYIPVVYAKKCDVSEKNMTPFCSFFECRTCGKWHYIHTCKELKDEYNWDLGRVNFGFDTGCSRDSWTGRWYV